MYAIKRLLVGLDLTEIDDTVIAYTSYLADVSAADKVYFLHVAKSLDLPEQIIEKHPDLITPVDESIRVYLEKKVKQHFQPKGKCEYNVEVREGSSEDKILRWSDIKEIDLIVMGRKLEMKGKGMLPGRLARTAHCSMIFVPEYTKPKISNILVAVDFSEKASYAFEEAITLKQSTGAKLTVQHSYEVPSGYHYSGKSFDEVNVIMRENAEKQGHNFFKKAKVSTEDIKLTLTLDKENDPAERAYEIADEIKADLIVIGSKGRNSLASILLGSVADKMTRYNSKIPLLIVKNKQENMSFFDALLKL